MKSERGSGLEGLPDERSSDMASRREARISRSERLRRLRLVAVRLPSIEDIDELEAAATRLGMTRHAFILAALRRAVDAALREAGP